MDDYYEKMNEEMSKEDKKAYGSYENMERAESDVRCLTEAEEIRMDKDRLAMAMKCAKKKAKALNDITKGE